MSMKILVIHEFKVTLKIVRNYLMTECEKVGVVEICSSPDRALELLAAEKFDLVFCGLEMDGTSGLFIHARMVKEGKNTSTPFIVMTSSANEQLHQRLSANGIAHVLPLPFNPEQLRLLIDQVCNPRQHRSHKRYSIPQTRVTIQIGQKRLAAHVFNISINGVLCELNYADKGLNLLSLVSLFVDFPPEYDSIAVDGITASPVRINVQAWDPDQQPRMLVCAWRFVDIPAPAYQSLSRVFEKVDHDLGISGRQ